jgi:hypothetical protein
VNRGAREGLRHPPYHSYSQDVLDITIHKQTQITYSPTNNNKIFHSTLVLTWIIYAWVCCLCAKNNNEQNRFFNKIYVVFYSV